MVDAYRKSISTVFRDLDSSEDGISQKEAEQRLSIYGKNQVEKRGEESWIVILLKQFRSPLVYILVIAGIISLALRENVDAIVILLAIFLDVIVGFIQEYRASGALKLLFRRTVIETVVVRKGRLHQMNAEELVPGDVIDLKSGDKVPADARIIEGKNVRLDESLLTGESLPRNKMSKRIKKKRVLAERDNMIYLGTHIVSGYCKALVVSTGCTTELGKIAESLLKSKKEKTLIQKELDKLAGILGYAFVIIISGIFFIGVLRGNEWGKMFSESVALAVSALPEGLPVAVTVIFAIGMQKVLKKRGLIRSLTATETLGRTEILCIDKTGTLTKGKMEVVEIALSDKTLMVDEMNLEESYLAKEVIRTASLCNHAFIEEKEGKKISRGTPTDIALLNLGKRFNMSKDSVNKKTPILDIFPFSQELKLSACLVKSHSKNKLYICGAPETILERSGKIEKVKFQSVNTEVLNDSEKQKILEKNNELGAKGYRVLAAAYKNFDSSHTEITEEFSDLTFLGLVVISDPLRLSSKETVRCTTEAGLKLVLVTGDHVNTAINVAKKVGIPAGKNNILSGYDLEEMSESELDRILGDIHIFARVNPQDKVRIVKAWKRKQKVVAMTGDGINDAPALDLADIGVALGSGTDVAKEAADLVLLDDDLKTILNAIEEGRGILENIKKVVIYLLSDSLAEVVLVGFAVIIGWPLPLLASQILWINLVEDGLPDIALSLEPIAKDVLKIPPKVFKRPIMDKEVQLFSFFIAWIDDIALLFLYVFLHSKAYSMELVRTIIFATLTFDSLFFAYSCKSLRKPIWKINILNNKVLNLSFILGILLLFTAVYFPPLQTMLRTIPLGLSTWGIITAISLIEFITLEIVKEYFIAKRFWK